MISQEESPELSPIRPVDAPVKSVSGAWAKKSNATFDLEADFAPLGGGSSPPLPGGSSGSFWDSMKKTSASENTKGQAKKAPTSPAAFEQDGNKYSSFQFSIFVKTFCRHQLELSATNSQKLSMPQRQPRPRPNPKKTRSRNAPRKRRRASFSLSKINFTCFTNLPYQTILIFNVLGQFIVWLVQLINSACFINDLYHVWTSSE